QLLLLPALARRPRTRRLRTGREQPRLPFRHPPDPPPGRPPEIRLVRRRMARVGTPQLRRPICLPTRYRRRRRTGQHTGSTGSPPHLRCHPGRRPLELRRSRSEKREAPPPHRAPALTRQSTTDPPVELDSQTLIPHNAGEDRVPHAHPGLVPPPGRTD